MAILSSLKNEVRTSVELLAGEFQFAERITQKRDEGGGMRDEFKPSGARSQNSEARASNPLCL